MRIKLLSLVAVAAAFTACTDSNTTSTTSSSSGGSSSGNAGACAETGTNVAAPTEAAVVDGTDTPDFSCYTNPVGLGPSQMVPVSGCVTIFGVGSAVTNGLKISVYGIDQNPGPGGDTPMYGTHDITRDAASGCESEGVYAFPALPTNTPLIFKTFDTSTTPQAVDTYQWRVVIRADHHRDNNGDFKVDANIIFNSTYTAIPNTAGRSIEGGNVLSDKTGKGALAGAVHDCGGRGGRTVKNATVGGSCFDSRAKLVYFNGNDDSPSPDLQRHATNKDGLYAVVNVKTTSDTGVKGVAQEVEAKVLVGGQVFSSGPQRVMLFPDSVTIFSPEGLLPTQMVGTGTSSSTMTTASSTVSASSSAGTASSTATASSSTASSTETASSTAGVSSSAAAGVSSSAAAGVSSSTAGASSEDGTASSAAAASSGASAGSGSS